MASKSAVSPIYSPDYYRFKKLIQDPDFKKEKRALFSWYKENDCIASVPFLTYEAYIAWLNVFWDRYHALDDSLQDQTRIPGYFAEHILERFGFDPKNSAYKDFLIDHLFRGKKEYSEALFGTLLKRNKETDVPELFIQVFPHTRIEHLIKHWDAVQQTQEKFLGYRGKNKKWETFDRDLYIHAVYKRLQHKLVMRRARRGEKPIYVQTWLVIKKKYPGVALEQIKDSVTRVEQLTKLGG